MFNAFYTTITGQQYIAKSMEDGKKLALTRGAFGNGSLPSGSYPVSATALASKLGDMGLTLKAASSTELKVTTQFTNKVGNSVLAGFNLTEMGIFGKIQNTNGTDDENYPEKLLFYGICSKDESDYIPATLTEFLINWSVSVSGEATIESVIDESLVYATLKNLTETEDAIYKGYFLAEGNSYSGPASNHGIEVGRIEGKSEQIITTGKNILKSTITTQTINGVTFTVNDDGSVTVNGTAAGLFAQIVGELELTEGTEYILSGCPATGNSDTYRLDGRETEENGGSALNETLDYGSGVTFKATSSRTINICIRLASGAVINNKTFYPMVRLASNDDASYEPYTGGEPAPNPEYPQEIKSFTCEEFISHGFQLFDASLLPSNTAGGATVNNNGDGSFTISGSGTHTEMFSSAINIYKVNSPEYIKMLRAGKIHIASSAVYPRFYFQLYDANDVKLLDINSQDILSAEITEEMIENTARIRLSIYGGTGYKIVPGTYKPMVYQEGNGEWEPFHGVSAINPQSNIILRNLPDGTCDTYENGVITRRVGAVTFDGSSDENWTARTIEGGETTTRYGIDITDSTSGEGLCSHFKDRGSGIHGDYEYSISLGGTIYININKEYLSVDSADGFKEWLASNPLTVLYKLKTPVIEVATLPTVPSWNPHTSVHLDCEVEPTAIEWHVKNQMVAVDPHPIGSVIITSTNENPANSLGGTWELVDKHLAFRTVTGENDSEVFTMDTDELDSCEYVVCVHEHQATLELTFTTNELNTNNTLVIGTFEFSKLGFVKTIAVQRALLMSYNQAPAMWSQIGYTNGTLLIFAYEEIENHIIASGSKYKVIYNVQIDPSNMLDDYCDKFFWKRTA